VQEKSRSFYEVYSLQMSDKVPEDYREISFVCLCPDGCFESPGTVNIVCRTASKKVPGLEDCHFHQQRTANYAANQAPSDLFASRYAMYLWIVLTIGVQHNA